ncbi:hypothetical protein TRFO_31990 [Tritrichomonas foetus]|uniref:Uncharacterized protein n=1 Tax=Tritrichomonas foetus TaxID=1144522 RepID=A0A1J4JUP8_9EUKA|nr:hypothetical protein TRFO_31990 [Tritrichomonas foetus]|eukprot:OHT01244.1 hypothetical protein TRFO_31990 [Tritrichomonas foetus]
MKDFLDDPDIVFSKKIEYEFSASTKSFIRCNFLMMYFFQIYDPLIMKLKHYNLLFQECPQMNGKTASIIINGFLKNAQEYKKEIDQLDTDTKEQIAERELFMKNYKICLENVANFYKYEFVELLDLKLKVLVYIAHNNICNLCDSDLKKKDRKIYSSNGEKLIQILKEEIEIQKE